jgi:hypothetical protein
MSSDLNLAIPERPEPLPFHFITRNHETLLLSSDGRITHCSQQKRTLTENVSAYIGKLPPESEKHALFNHASRRAVASDVSQLEVIIVNHSTAALSV